MVDGMFVTQNKLGYWSVTRSFLSMQRGCNTRLLEVDWTIDNYQLSMIGLNAHLISSGLHSKPDWMHI